MATIAAPLRGRKETQRERLLGGMVAAVGQGGYSRANVSSVILHAGVSRPTFYEYFTDKDDCFLTTLRDINGLLLARVEEALRTRPWEPPIEAALRDLVDFARHNPAMARCAMNETASGGPCALSVREAGIVSLATTVESAYGELTPTTSAPDISLETVFGAVHRVISSRLRHGERALAGLLEGLLAWVRGYETERPRHRWRSGQTYSPPARSSSSSKTAALLPARLAPGRPRASEGEVAENNRLRIMLATASAVAEKGYSATTLADIVKRAELDTYTFYKTFAEKQDAFMAAHDLGFQELMAVTADAFFAAASWPERVWEAAGAFIQVLERHPTIARAGFLEAYAVGPDAVERVEDSHTAFTTFLREGYRLQTQIAPPPAVALEAIVCAVFEILHRRIREGREPQLVNLLPSVAHLCLTPFLGIDEANAFIDQKVDRRRTGV